LKRSLVASATSLALPYRPVRRIIPSAEKTTTENLAEETTRQAVVIDNEIAGVVAEPLDRWLGCGRLTFLLCGIHNSCLNRLVSVPQGSVLAIWGWKDLRLLVQLAAQIQTGRPTDIFFRQ
jgi:hypothetical protein